ncbi:DUF1868 domain-containing protein [Rhizobium oryzicola]|uniref:DUF1868 domain-containing protein n=1 Tax=Rhizobium oryzicola TaxID=1232668 RepID=A0ABT8SVC1_9HYPH|nr:DUF1868 domain-containing protein [Rhizobium oryzicola]MDO1582373.1 DUF1868 domain-containing protein [Rhizobium oryzicola]
MLTSALSPVFHAYSETHHPLPSRHVGVRYDRSGNFLYEPGNTIVCHLTEGSETQAAIIDLRSLYLDLPEVERLAFTPVSSLHMTLFQGIIEHRRQPGFWPADLPLDTPIDDMTQIMAQRLARFQAGPSFRVGLVDLRPTGMTLDGVTEADKAALAEWRNRLVDLFGYRHPDHETYRFHITFAYVIRTLSDAALLEWQQVLGEQTEAFQARFEAIELNPPAFCSFNDMKHFEELVVLDHS